MELLNKLRIALGCSANKQPASTLTSTPNIATPVNTSSQRLDMEYNRPKEVMYKKKTVWEATARESHFVSIGSYNSVTTQSESKETAILKALGEFLKNDTNSHVTCAITAVKKEIYVETTCS